MKNTKQIHQLLKDAIEYKADYAYDYVIKKCKDVLALLPCETCNGTGEALQPRGKDKLFCGDCALFNTKIVGNCREPGYGTKADNNPCDRFRTKEEGLPDYIKMRMGDFSCGLKETDE